MILRRIIALVLKPLCAVGFIGVVVAALHVERHGLADDPIAALESALLHLILAILCLCVCLLDSRGRNVVANHGGIGLLVGLLLGFLAAARLMLGFTPKGDLATHWLGISLTVLWVALPGAGFGLVIGVLRRRMAQCLGEPASQGGEDVKELRCGEIAAAILARPRTVRFAIVCIGLGVIFLPRVIDRYDRYQRIVAPPPIDKVDVAQVIQLANATDVEPARPVRSPRRIWHANGINTMAFSLDGKYLATGGFYDRAIGIWNTADWTLAGSIPQSGWITQLAFSPDGMWLYVAGEDGRQPILCRFGWRTGERDRVFDGHTKRVDGLALSADGQTLISSSVLEGVPHFWDTTAGTFVRSSEYSGSRFVYAPQRDVLFQWSNLGRSVRAVVAGKRMPDFLFGANVLAAAFTSDEQLLIVAGRSYGRNRQPA